MSEINALLEELESGELLRGALSGIKNVTELLGNRDSDLFLIPWMAAYRLVEERKADRAAIEDANPIIARLREAAFRQVFERHRSSDLAGYISDDFGLIGDALALRENIPLVDELLQSYRRGKVPDGL